MAKGGKEKELNVQKIYYCQCFFDLLFECMV